MGTAQPTVPAAVNLDEVMAAELDGTVGRGGAFRTLAAGGNGRTTRSGRRRFRITPRSVRKVIGGEGHVTNPCRNRGDAIVVSLERTPGRRWNTVSSGPFLSQQVGASVHQYIATSKPLSIRQSEQSVVRGLLVRRHPSDGITNVIIVIEGGKEVGEDSRQRPRRASSPLTPSFQRAQTLQAVGTKSRGRVGVKGRHEEGPRFSAGYRGNPSRRGTVSDSDHDAIRVACHESPAVPLSGRVLIVDSRPVDIPTGGGQPAVRLDTPNKGGLGGADGDFSEQRRRECTLPEGEVGDRGVLVLSGAHSFAQESFRHEVHALGVVVAAQPIAMRE